MDHYRHKPEAGEGGKEEWGEREGGRERHLSNED